MKNIDGFTEKLDLPIPEDVKIEYDIPIFHKDRKNDAEDDYRHLREKMRFFLASGEFILTKSINALNCDPNPRIIEASSLILRNILKISDNMLTLHEKTKVIMKEDEVKDENKDENKDKITASLVDIIAGINKIDNE